MLLDGFCTCTWALIFFPAPLDERQPGDIRNKHAIRRLVGAGVGKDGRYITTDGREEVCAAGDDVENGIDWDENEVVECD